MGYELPRYRDLHNKAIKLHNSFNELINRYIPPTYEQIRQKVNSLEEKYNEKVRKKSGFFVNTTPDLRRDQVACISQLLPKLPQEGTVQLLNNAQNILLGAVLYRYQRIILSYNSKFLFYLGYSADNSCVKLILEEEFEFEKQKLDAETIATCCEAYKAYLEQEDVSSDKKKKVADQFPYIQEDTEFFSKLKEIIVHARVKARPITIQLQVISFVQSAAAAFRRVDETALATIPKLGILVMAKLSKTPLLTKEHLIELLDAVQPGVDKAVKEILILSLPDKITAKGVLTEVIVPDVSPVKTEERYINFQDYVHAALIMNSQYALLGAYILAMSCPVRTPSLRDVLNEGIGAQGPNQLDDNAKKLGLIAFQNYTSIIDSIDCKCWHAENGYTFMRKELKQQVNQFIKSEKQEIADTTATIF